MNTYRQNCRGVVTATYLNVNYFMEKFQKLSRTEMKKITGGTVLCPCNEYTKCQCPNGPVVCVPISYDNNCNGSRATGAVCMDYCNPNPGVVLPTYFWTDASCTIRA